MKTCNQLSVVACAAFVMFLSASPVAAQQGRGGGGGRRGGGNTDAQANGNNQGGRRGFPGGEPSPEAEELQKAIDSNASKDELKAKLTKFREARKDKEAKLAKAQEDLKKVLTVK